jgi:hypothetical protein
MQSAGQTWEATRLMGMQDVIFRQTLYFGDGTQDGIEGADAQRRMVGNSQPVMMRTLRPPD